MKTEESFKLLIQAIELAQSRGAYNLKESATILGAIETLTTNPNKKNTMENETTQTPEEVISAPIAVEATEVATPVEEVTPEATPEAEVAPEAPTEEVVA